MANERLYLCHKKYPGHKIMLMKRLGSSFYFNSEKSTEYIEKFTLDVLAEADYKGWDDYDEGFYVVTETQWCKDNDK